MTRSPDHAPLVTVQISTRNRASELVITLRELRRQTYRPLELIVIDDFSCEEIDGLVKAEWPDARVIRNSKNLGLIASRSAGMRMASGEHVIIIDDDSCFTDPHDISRAVARLAASPRVGVLAFLIHNGALASPPSGIQDGERLTQTFVGCGHMIRKSVIDRIGGFCDFYHYGGEENEYALRVMDAGWTILFYPAVAVHHRVSNLGRNPGKIWKYAMRNSIWTSILRMPAGKLPMELAWKFTTATLDAARLLQVKGYFWTIYSTFRQLPRLIRLRRPISTQTLRLYEHLRFGLTLSADDSLAVAPITLRQRLRWLAGDWWHRRRARAFWDRRAGGIGRSPVAVFSDGKPESQPRPASFG